jgi:hypothetical protein
LKGRNYEEENLSKKYSFIAGSRSCGYQFSVLCVWMTPIPSAQPQPAAETIGTDLPQGYILAEIPSERERSIKHYLKDDGTYEAVVYPNPVHYEGRWNLAGYRQ